MSPTAMSRRRFLGVCGALLCMPSPLGACSSPDRSESGPWWRSVEELGGPSLRERAAAKGLWYGAAAEQHTLGSDPGFADCFVRECAMLVPEVELKWQVLRPAPSVYDFGPADRLARFASTYGLLFRGHTLVWHLGVPDWVRSSAGHDAETVLVEHITRVARHYAGAICSWDVVNEVVLPGAGPPNDLRPSFWLQTIGPGYIELAFRTAAAADPGALLVYNEYGLQYDFDDQERKRTAVLRLLERLVRASAPVHALGIQAHLRAAERRFTPSHFRAFLHEVAGLGLQIMITELDVNDEGAAGDVAEIDRIVADTYERFLTTTLDEPAVIAVLTWGLSDRYSWLRSAHRGGQERRPLPLDDSLRRKPAWDAIARAFDGAPPRPPQWPTPALNDRAGGGRH